MKKIIALLLMSIMCLSLFAGCKSKNVPNDSTELDDNTEATFDWAEYIGVAYAGRENYGRAKITYNDETISTLATKAQIDEYLISKIADEDILATKTEECQKLTDLLCFTLEKETRISSGERLEITIDLQNFLLETGATIDDFMKFFDLNFDTTYTVWADEFPEYEDLGLYDLLNGYVEIGGANGGAEAHFNFPKDLVVPIGDQIFLVFLTEDFLKGHVSIRTSVSINVIVDNTIISVINAKIKGTSLSKGDYYSIYINETTEWHNKNLRQYGYSIYDVGRKYRVNNLGVYVNSAEQLTEEVIDKFYEEISTYIKENDDYAKETYSMYLLTLKPAAVNKYKSKYRIFMIYKENNGCHHYAKISDLIINQDGTVSANIDANRGFTGWSTEKETVKAMYEDWNISEGYVTDNYTIQKIR